MTELSLHDDENLMSLKTNIEKIKTAMISTITHSTRSHASPMHTVSVDEYGALWFYAYNDSQRVLDISENNFVNVIYSSPEKGIYISVTGYAQLISDRKLLHKYWDEDYRTWAPDGPDAPGLYLLKISVSEAEMWDVETSAMTRFAKTTIAKIRDEQPNLDNHIIYHH